MKNNHPPTLRFNVQTKPIPLPRSRSKAGQRPYIARDHPVRKWKEDVALICSNVMQRYGWAKPFIKQPMGVSMALTFYGVGRGGDLSNYLKAVEDALIGIAYDDDIQVAHISCIRTGLGKDPYLTVSIVEWQED